MHFRRKGKAIISALFPVPKQFLPEKKFCPRQTRAGGKQNVLEKNRIVCPWNYEMCTHLLHNRVSWVRLKLGYFILLWFSTLCKPARPTLSLWLDIWCDLPRRRDALSNSAKQATQHRPSVLDSEVEEFLACRKFVACEIYWILFFLGARFPTFFSWLINHLEQG